jgi:nudix-type nucleoside diphosphatase (YffH/AdpP family)
MECRPVSDELPPSRLPPVRLLAREVIYKGWLTLEIATLEQAVHGKAATMRREVHHHGHGASVLAYDAVKRTAVLVRQARAGVLLAGEADPVLMEVVAGLVDAGESPEETVRREAWEEAGLRLGALQYLGSPFSSPGALTERAHLFLGEIDGTAPRGAGGGLAEEHEEIEVIEVPLVTLARLADAGRVGDLKTLTLIGALRLRRPELFA